MRKSRSRLTGRRSTQEPGRSVSRSLGPATGVRISSVTRFSLPRRGSQRSATQIQNSLLSSTGAAAASDQTDVLTDECFSSGNCDGTQDANVNGQTAHNHASGHAIAIDITCGDVSLFPGGDGTTTITLRSLAQETGACVPVPGEFGGG